MVLLGEFINRQWEAVNQYISLTGNKPSGADFSNDPHFERHPVNQYRTCMDTFFCDPHAPWQKDGAEHTIGKIRRALPGKNQFGDDTTSEIAKSEVPV